MLGKERVQARAIDEVRALPPERPYKDNVLELLGNLRVILEARETIEPDEQELIMQLSPLYLEKIQAAERVGEARGEARGKAEGDVGLIVRQLTRRFGAIDINITARIQQLSIAQLGEMLKVNKYLSCHNYIFQDAR